MKFKEPTFNEWVEQMKEDREISEPYWGNLLHMWSVIRTLQRKVANLEDKVK